MPMIGLGNIVDSLSTIKEDNLPRIDMMEMMKNERLTMELNENNKIIWLFDGKAFTGYVYGEQRGAKIEGEFRNGFEHGSHKEWYPNTESKANGQLKEERIYNNGIKISTKTWNEKGNIISYIEH